MKRLRCHEFKRSCHVGFQLLAMHHGIQHAVFKQELRSLESSGQLLADLMAPRQGVAIGGAHGKTTTTAMVGLVLDRAGLDPTGMGGVIAGFGDQREVELLVEAGFTPLEAIHIATFNGAQYLGELERIGTIAAGKQADLVVIKGDPSKKIEDVENVETVFKDGVGYDSAKLIESVRGAVGSR